MHSFKDTKGREWRLDGNFASYGRVRDATGVKLYDIATENRDSLVQLSDALTLGQVLWAMVEPQAKAASVTPEDFASSFSGETVTAAYTALIDEMIFFCHPRQRKLLEAIVKKVREAEERADQMVGEKIAQFESEIDSAIDQWTRGCLDMNLPGSSAFTPATGLSESCSTPPAAEDGKTGITPVPLSPS